jgi:hypothetical protein
VICTILRVPAAVHLRRKSHQKHHEFALRIDPVSDRKIAVFSISLLIYYGLKFDTTTGLNLGANQHSVRLHFGHSRLLPAPGH